jgi:ADP-ribose pyrophosphatase
MTAQDFNVRPDAVEVRTRETVFQGYFRIDRYKLRHACFRGGMGPEIQREVLERGHAVAVLPYDPVRDAVVLQEQFRVGALAAGRPPWLLEIVAGIIDDGETPEDVARREALEEAGCHLTAVERIQTWLSSPGATSETVTLYVGRVDAGNVGGLHGLPEEGEDIRPVVLPFEEALALMQGGRLDNSTILIALQWLALNRPALRDRWMGAGSDKA